MNQVVPQMFDKVMSLQAAAGKLPQISLPTEHYFANGMYARQCFIPAGTLFVGAKHKQEHFFMMLQGRAHVTTENGVALMVAPCVIISQSGTKRAGYCHEDTIFLAVHRTDLKDIEDIRREVTEADPLELFDAYNQVKDEVLKYMEGE